MLPMIFSLRRYGLYAIVTIIAFLILADIYLIYRNNCVIEFNKDQQEKAEHVKVNTSEVMRSLHLLDLAVRSYAFVNNQHYKEAVSIATNDRNQSMRKLEGALNEQGFSMNKFYQLRDSIARYVVVTQSMLDLIDKNDQPAYVKLLEADPGYNLWLQYQDFSKEVYAFEDDISRTAQAEYQQALNNSYLLQIILFVLAVPTLAYTAYYTNRALSLSERLRDSEAEKAALLAQQNQVLERTVHERTREILAQNEEITAQNEEISMHNEKLTEAKQVIEQQNLVIQEKNNELASEVERQTQDLKSANAELTEHNARLEQFAFVISHNLRAPMSRILGLSSILDFTKEPGEISEIASLMMQSTHELDRIIQDLTDILAVQKIDVKSLKQTRLDSIYDKVISTLDGDIRGTKASISADFTSAGNVKTIPSYLESIFYNLISNAIKYRHPDRDPIINLRSVAHDEYVQIEIADNGLGIDTEANKENLFSLYKRFHSHVEGRGLGLYLVKTQVSALGGRIDLKSKQGDGSVFTVWMKAEPVTPAAQDRS
jgi:signal transduction histidine kinase